MRHIRSRDWLNGEQGAGTFSIGADQLSDDRAGADDEIVRKKECKRLALNGFARTVERMGDAEWLVLGKIVKASERGRPLNVQEHLGVARRAQRAFEPSAVAKVLLDRFLAVGDHKDDIRDPGGNRLLNRVLDERLVDYRQHLFGDSFRCWEHAGTKTRRKDDGLCDCGH